MTDHIDAVTRKELEALEPLEVLNFQEGERLHRIREAILEEGPEPAVEVTNIDLAKAEIHGHVKEKF